MPHYRLLPLLLSLLFAAGCASQPKAQTSKNVSTTAPAPESITSYEEDLGLYDEEAPTPSIADPLEPFNRVMFKVNDFLYLNVLDPTATLYSKILPQGIRENVANAFRNAAYPHRAVNSLLQAKPAKFAAETRHFILNTVVGVGGLLKASDKLDPDKPSPEDTNQTLAIWGIGDGVYLYLPLFGPTTLRGGVGLVGDYFMDPVSYVEDDIARYGLSAERTVNIISLRLGDYQALKDSALDPYVAFKDAYLQHTQKRIEE